MSRRGAGNLGRIRLRAIRRSADPMRDFDALPPPLRRWLAQAALPWSPASCRAIWRRALRAGGGVDAALDRLDRAKQAVLQRLEGRDPAIWVRGGAVSFVTRRSAVRAQHLRRDALTPAHRMEGVGGNGAAI